MQLSSQSVCPWSPIITHGNSRGPVASHVYMCGFSVRSLTQCVVAILWYAVIKLSQLHMQWCLEPMLCTLKMGLSVGLSMGSSVLDRWYHTYVPLRQTPPDLDEHIVIATQYCTSGTCDQPSRLAKACKIPCLEGLSMYGVRVYITVTCCDTVRKLYTNRYQIKKCISFQPVLREYHDV